MNTRQIDEAALEIAADAIGKLTGWEESADVCARAAITAYLSAENQETVMADGDALLNCPFCGDEAAICGPSYMLPIIKCQNKKCGAEHGSTANDWNIRAKATQSDNDYCEAGCFNPACSCNVQEKPNAPEE